VVILNTIFLLITVVTFLSLFVFIPLALINVVKKNKEKSTKMFKFSGIALVAMIVSFIGFGVTVDETEVTDEPEKVESQEDKKESKEETEEEKAAREAAEKAEAEAEAEKKAKEEADKLAAEKEYYLNNVKTAIDTQLSMYDAAWSEIWQPTFEGVGNGTVSVYTAYENMKVLEQRYDTLYSSFDTIDGSGLSKDNKELLEEFKSNMKSATMWRSETAEKAREMFDEGDYSPSKLDKLNTYISYADSEIMKAALALTSIEMDLGLIEESIEQ